MSLGSKMIDPPVVRQALTLVEQAKELGLIDTEPDRDTGGNLGVAGNEIDETRSEVDR